MSVLIRIDCYLRRTGLPVTLFGRLAVNDPRLVHDLKRGREPRAKMLRRIENFMLRHPDPIPGLYDPQRKGGAR